RLLEAAARAARLELALEALPVPVEREAAIAVRVRQRQRRELLADRGDRRQELRVAGIHPPRSRPAYATTVSAVTQSVSPSTLWLSRMSDSTRTRPRPRPEPSARPAVCSIRSW